MTLRLPSSLLAIAASAAGVGTAWAQDAAPSEFWNPPVFATPGQPSRVSESPSTTFVITADEIRRSGASSLSEILRRVPGLDVRSLTATDGQLGLRGFAYEIADRILVLVDGRTVYIDFFGGTAFEMLPVSLVDIEQIEVVLGPGSSIYGNKAMLGTVNIVTRSAADYPFAEARVDAATPADGRVGARAGAIRGPWRLRATGVGRRLTLFQPDGPSAQCRSCSPAAAGGGTLSATYAPSAGDEASLEVGAVHGDTYIIPTATRIDGFEATLAHVRARGKLALGGFGSPYGDLHLDAVWNAGRIRSSTFPSAATGMRAEYQTPYARLQHELRTRLRGIGMHVRWGGEVRLNTLDSTITTGERHLWNVAGFASDELLLGRLRLTGGLRVDRSNFTDVSYSPRVSVVWSPVDGHQLRAAFNTGYNNAHPLHYFADLPLGPLLIRGNPDLKAEHVRYGEVGWNAGLTHWLRTFASAFAYRFEDWISLDPRLLTPTGTGAFALPYNNNEVPLTVYGGETGIELLARTFSAYASYAFMARGTREYPYQIDAHGSPRDKVSAGVRVGRGHETKLRGAYATVDAQYFGPSEVARLPQNPLADRNPFEKTALREYVMAHARVGYAFASGLDLSLAASNLLDDTTVQFPGGERPERRVAATVAYYR
jgi:iron complex outermembrane receptor protein